MILGSHVSTQGGFAKAVGRAVDVGCECLQIFVSNPPRQWPVFTNKREGSVPVTQLPGVVEPKPVPCKTKNNNRWHAKALAKQDIDAWLDALGQSNLTHPIAHASYLINLASPKAELFQKSIDALVVELERANQLQLEGLVVHPGAFTESSEEEGLDRIVDAVCEALDRVKPGTCRLLLENTAGQGTCLGYTMEQLARMLDGINAGQRIGVCLDTCHAFAAGYEINTKRGFKELRKEINDGLPKHAVRALHLNDSKKPLGSRVDRHEHIGLGEIGLEGFRLVMHDSMFRKLPGYLETEKGTEESSGEEWDVINLRTLRSLE